MRKAVLITSSYDFGSSLSKRAKRSTAWPKHLEANHALAGGKGLPRFTPFLTPPLGILALGSYLAAHDVPVELIDVQMDFGFGLTSDTEHVVCQRVARYLRDQRDAIAWVGISQLSDAGNSAMLAQEIHTALPDVPIIFGGYFPSNTYQILLQKYPFITAIVRGDGEAAALEISRSLAQGRSFLSDQTPSLAWRDGGEIHTTTRQSTILDDLPLLDFRLLRHPSFYQIIHLMSSRGCPFQCSYCLENNMRSYGVYPLHWVDQQLSHLEAVVPNDQVFFFDPIFGLGKQRTRELCQIMHEHRFNYAVESRVDVLKPDLIPALREARVEVIYFGLESASPATLLRMNKVRSTAKAEEYVRKALEVLGACFENDVTTYIGVMLGFLGDTEADYQATVEFLNKVGQIHSEIAVQTGYTPGFVPLPFITEVYDGSPLADLVTAPSVILQPKSPGKRTIISPSPGLDLDTTLRYQTKISRQGAYTPRMLERFQRFSGFSLEHYLAAYPELTDDEGVIVFDDSLRRFPQEFSIASTSIQ